MQSRKISQIKSLGSLYLTMIVIATVILSTNFGLASAQNKTKKKAEGARRALRYQRYTSKLPQVQLSRQDQWTRKMTSSSRSARSHRHQ
jgi:hypothetical protein